MPFPVLGALMPTSLPAYAAPDKLTRGDFRLRESGYNTVISTLDTTLNRVSVPAAPNGANRNASTGSQVGGHAGGPFGSRYRSSMADTYRVPRTQLWTLTEYAGQRFVLAVDPKKF